MADPETGQDVIGCAAPHAALYLAPSGAVQACCRNDDLTTRTGGDERPTLREVWNGPMLTRLREAVDRGDFSRGCQSCEHAISTVGRARSVAADFDRYLGDRDLAGPRHLDLALSNTCNLSCEMCNGELSSSIRSGREHRPALRSPYDDAFFDELREMLPGVDSIIFKGGEPFLAREARRVFELLDELGSTAHVTVVTNGTRWGPAIESWMRRLRMDVDVSIDGATAETVEAIRTGVDHERLRSNLVQIVATARDYGGTVKWNFCHMPQNSHELAAVLREADELDIDVQVIAVDAPPRFSLSHEPLDRLEALLAGREAEAAEASTLGRNRPAWDAELDGLRALVATARGAAESPVLVRGRDPLDAFEAAVRELVAWSSREPLRVTMEDSIVTAVDGPDWAQSLEVRRWVGAGGQDLIGFLEAGLGPMAPSSEVLVRTPVIETALRFGPEDATRRVRSLRVAEWLPTGVERLHVAIAIEPAGVLTMHRPS